MPVSGLPVAAEITLGTLLQKNVVSSWKITGDRNNSTVFILRLTAQKERVLSLPHPKPSLCLSLPHTKTYRLSGLSKRQKNRHRRHKSETDRQTDRDRDRETQRDTERDRDRDPLHDTCQTLKTPEQM